MGKILKFRAPPNYDLFAELKKELSHLTDADLAEFIIDHYADIYGIRHTERWHMVSDALVEECRRRENLRRDKR